MRRRNLFARLASFLAVGGSLFSQYNGQPLGKYKSSDTVRFVKQPLPPEVGMVQDDKYKWPDATASAMQVFPKTLAAVTPSGKVFIGSEFHETALAWYDPETKKITLNLSHDVDFEKVATMLAQALIRTSLYIPHLLDAPRAKPLVITITEERE